MTTLTTYNGIDLAQFCNLDRKGIDQPFLVEIEPEPKNVYATNGTIIIRTPWDGTGPLLVKGEQQTNNGSCVRGSRVLKLFTDCEPGPAAQWLPLPHDRIGPAEVVCDQCQGKTTLCPECGGEGTVEWEYNGQRRTYYRDDDCPACCGRHQCDKCNDTGKLDAPNVELSPNIRMRAAVAAKLAMLPGVEIDVSRNNSDLMQRFRFTGGEGVFCRVRVPNK